MNNRIIVLLVFAAMVGIFYSCKKDGEQLAAVTHNAISVINAGGDTLNFYENGTRINSGSTLLPSGQYQNLTITAGAQRYQFKKAGNPNTLIDLPINFDPADDITGLPFYTMFVAGESAAQVFVLRDTIPADTFAHVRYVNASPDAGNIEFTISTYPTSKQAFGSATPFLQVPAGKVFYSMIREGETTPLASGNITVSAHVSYTLFSKGLIKGTGTHVLGARILPTVH